MLFLYFLVSRSGMPVSYHQELEVAIRAVRVAAHVCRAVQDDMVTPQSLEKKDRISIQQAMIWLFRVQASQIRWKGK